MFSFLAAEPAAPPPPAGEGCDGDSDNDDNMSILGDDEDDDDDDFKRDTVAPVFGANIEHTQEAPATASAVADLEKARFVEEPPVFCRSHLEDLLQLYTSVYSRRPDHPREGDPDAQPGLLVWTPSYESRLLQAAGPVKHPTDPSKMVTLPHCARGNECIGAAGALRSDTGVEVRLTLMQALEEGELRGLEATGVLRYRKGSPLGGSSRYCVLCMRWLMGRFVAHREVLGHAPYIAHGKSVVFQAATNPVDTDDRYAASVMMHPAAAAASNGLSAPMARLHHASLYWTQRGHGSGAQWFVDQSAMLECSEPGEPHFPPRTTTRA